MEKRIFLSAPHMSGAEEKFVHEAFLSNYIAPLGPMVDAFEASMQELTGRKYCLALSSGTAALHLAVRHLNITHGDIVYASTLTFIPSVSPVIQSGGKLVFIDSSLDTWNMNPELLEISLAKSAQLGKLPKAVIPTDLYGQCANYDEIVSICSKYEIPVIFDSTEALGATYKSTSAGSKGWAAAFSFNGNKIITTSGGGMLATDDAKLAENARFLSQQARENTPHYEHKVIGYNYRMSNICAAIGRGQLTVLQDRVKRKREIFSIYERNLSHLPGIEFMKEASYGVSNRWLTVLTIDPKLFGCDRENVRQTLEKENIESRPVWKPMHLQPVFLEKYPSECIEGAVSEKFFANGLCLPSGTSLLDDEIYSIVEIIKSAYK